MRLEKVQCPAAAGAAVGCGPPSRYLVVLFAATMALAPSASVLAQQPAWAAGQT